MGVFDRIGETVVNLFSGKKGIILILVIIVSVGVWKYQFSGAGGEGGFRDHVEKATENVVKGSRLELEAIKKIKEENYDVALELLGTTIESYKSAKNELNLAYGSTNDENKKNWVKCMNETLDYEIQRTEKIFEGTRLDMLGKDEEAMKKLDDIKKLSKLAGQQRVRCYEFETKEIAELVK